MNSIDYSIIIPHKNIPELLQRCLDSIPRRDDLEIIVVDNNSSPELVDFDHFPGMDRSDVVMVRDNESKGAGGARNTGVSIARGRWILFVDADDMFNDCINQIFVTAMKRIKLCNNACDFHKNSILFRIGFIDKLFDIHNETAKFCLKLVLFYHDCAWYAIRSSYCCLIKNSEL